jgi:hypothetical protein
MKSNDEVQAKILSLKLEEAETPKGDDGADASPMRQVLHTTLLAGMIEALEWVLE